MTKEQFNEEAEFHKTFDESVARMKELQGNTSLGDLPLDSDYWNVSNVHNALYGGKKE